MRTTRKANRLMNAAKKLDEFFSEAVGPAEFEPTWLHPLHEVARQILEGKQDCDIDDEIIIDLASQIGNRNVKFNDGFFPERILDDGWKQGTATWVFLGRKTSPIRKRIGELVLIARPLPDQRLVYIAYHPTEQMGMTAMTSNVVGPSFNQAEVESYSRPSSHGGESREAGNNAAFDPTVRYVSPGAEST